MVAFYRIKYLILRRINRAVSEATGNAWHQWADRS